LNTKLYVINSWDDVTRLDLKICELLNMYNLKGTFFVVNNWLGKKISKKELCRISENHEIGAHTLNHLTLTQIGEEAAKKEILESKLRLENFIDKSVTSFAFPKGMYNKSHVKMVKEAKYLCARTTKPFYFNHVDNQYEMNVTLWAYPHALRDLKAMSRLIKIYKKFILNPYKIKNWSEIGMRIFDYLLEFGGVFHLMGHAWQIDEINGWEKLENLFEYIANREDVIYSTMTDYIKSRL
jgi:peptidoglycan/xylan/chitin deacetylase (PgdA/CDA1 family)